MTIMVVDNHLHRLRQLSCCLRATYPEDTVIEFVDPFRAVQYCSVNKVALVFVDYGLKPFDACEFAELATGLCKGVKVYVVADRVDPGGDIVEGNISGMVLRPLSAKNLEIAADI